MARRGRRPGETHTREQILETARQQFAERGYAKATLRSIAEAAGVHQALLFHYFGTKQRLFQQALDLPIDPAAILEHLLATTPRDQIAAAVVRRFISNWRDPDIGPRLRASLRRSLGDPSSPNLMRNEWQSVLIPRIAQAMEIPEANAAALLGQLFGLALTDSLIGVSQLNTLSEDQIVNLVAPVLNHYLIRRLPG